ncbi:MAG TPA: hypothetical protein VFH43_05895, partial [Candidatus Kapabacteria bacterium]|nr:hypothetical protein [Candidatus Kapabacteria bacterium]
MQKLLVLLLFVCAPSVLHAQGFYFQNVPDTLRFFTNSTQSMAIYARNTSDDAMNFYPDFQHTGGSYGQWEVEDESFLSLTPAGALVKTVITFTPSWESWYFGTSGKIYLYDTGWVPCDSVTLIGMRDTNRASAYALSTIDTIDFGTVDLGYDRTEQFVIRNTFSSPLTVDSA